MTKLELVMAPAAGEPNGGAQPRAVRLGPLILAAYRGGALDFRRTARDVLADDRDLFMLNFVTAGEARWTAGGAVRRCRPGAVLLLDFAGGFDFSGGADLQGLIVLAPRAFLQPLLPLPIGALPPGVALQAAWRFLEGVLALPDGALSDAQARFAAQSVRYLLAAALAPAALGDGRDLRRAVSLLDRTVAHIDARIAEPLEIAGLCNALGCSRSALYRATAPIGGIAELIARRRLAAVHRCLRDPGETRSIAAIAEAHGFADAAQFSRRFKRAFGATAGAVRVRSEGGEGEREFDPFRALIDAFADAAARQDQGTDDASPAVLDR